MIFKKFEPFSKSIVAKNDSHDVFGSCSVVKEVKTVSFFDVIILFSQMANLFTLILPL